MDSKGELSAVDDGCFTPAYACKPVPRFDECEVY